MNFMLNEIVYQWDQRAEKKPCDYFSVFDIGRIRRRCDQAPNSPRQRKNQIRDHEDIVEVMVVRWGDVHPSTTEERSG